MAHPVAAATRTYDTFQLCALLMYCHIHNDNIVDHFRVSTSDSWSCTKSSPSAAFPGVVSKMSSLHPTLKVMPCDSDHPHNWCLEFCSSPGSPRMLSLTR